MIWTMGLGKSSIPARLLVEDLRTMGIPAAFIEGGTILHGGIGGIKDDDRVYFFSESGETKEIVEAARILSENSRADKMAITMNGGTLSNYCERELQASTVLNDEVKDPMTRINGTHTMKMCKTARGIAAAWSDYADPPHWAHPANRESKAETS